MTTQPSTPDAISYRQLAYESGLRHGQELSEAMWQALKKLVIDVSVESGDQGHCICCGAERANEHDPNCSQQVAAYQAEVYRQRRRV